MSKQTKTTDFTYFGVIYIFSRYNVFIYIYLRLKIVEQQSVCSKCSAVIEFKTQKSVTLTFNNCMQSTHSSFEIGFAAFLFFSSGHITCYYRYRNFKILHQPKFTVPFVQFVPMMLFREF